MTAANESPRNASRTAQSVAALRAFHHLMDGVPKILEDPVAASIIDADALAQIRAREPRFDEPPIRALRVRVALRSRFSETRLERAMERGVRQCIILGAGFDTFAFRQPPWARALRIFEVDHAATQTLKRARLAEAGIAAPPNVEFVTIDFERVTLAEGLRASSLDFSKPAFFSCLGVLMYLTKPAVDAVFDLVASFSQGSEIAFTFTSPDSLDTAIAARVREIGEPWLSHFEPDTLARDLRAKGFSRVEFLDLAETEAAFFRGRTDGLEPPPRAGIAAAVV